MCKLQIGFPRLPEPGSGLHFEILRQWLRDCDENHTNCKSQKLYSLPTRLIDVGSKDHPVLKLYETQPRDRIKYFALSHPWGSPPHFCTSPENYERHRQSINPKELPATFQNAVTVTRELNLQYLWIDSICIIQGPEGDFTREAKRMEDVFSQAYCVLAATSATGQDDGFLKHREGRKYLTVQPNGRTPLYICEVIDNFDQHVLKSRLNQRGWVLQERALARRTIFFTNKQTYWECGCGVRCETLSKMHKSVLRNFPHVICLKTSACLLGHLRST